MFCPIIGEELLISHKQIQGPKLSEELVGEPTEAL